MPRFKTLSVSLKDLTDERERRILEFALLFLYSNIDEQAEWIFDDTRPVVTEDEVEELAVDLGVPFR